MARKSYGAHGDTVGDNGDTDGDSGAIETVDPAAVTAAIDARPGDGPGGAGEPDAPVKRRRGRKPGAGNVSKSKAKTGDISLNSTQLTIALKTVHDLIAMRTGRPEFALSQDEARIIAEPTAALLDHYGLAVPAAYGVWGNLFLALGTVYGPKISASLGYGAQAAVPAARAAYRSPEQTYGLELAGRLQ